jgi:hypothetical protein
VQFNFNTLELHTPQHDSPLPVLSPSSILPLPSSHCALIPSTKKSARFSKTLFFSVLKIAYV